MYNLPTELKLKILSYLPISENCNIYYEFLPEDYLTKLGLKECIKIIKEIREEIKSGSFFI
jgi:hypothetical protein